MTLTKLDRLAFGVLATSGLLIAAMLLADARRRTHSSGLAYLAPASGPREVWFVGQDGDRRALTDTGGTVFDYAISNDGQWLAYSALNQQGGVDLWISPTALIEARLLMDCDADRCSVPDWAPDGERIAFSREETTATGGLGPPRLWTVQVSSGQSAALYQDSQVLGHGPSWSPDGSRLAFFDGNVGAIRVLDVDGGAEQLLPSRMGMVGDWSPDGSAMLFNVMRVQTETATAALQLADLLQREIAPVELSDAAVRDIGFPAWSPNGEWVLVGVQSADGGPGRQLWLMRPDGSEAHSVLNDPAYTHGGYQWHPAGDRFVYQRFPLRVANAVPEIYVLSLDDGEPELLAADASSPSWVP